MTDFNSPLTPNAIAYACRQIADRAGVVRGNPDGIGLEALDVSLAYSSLDQSESDDADIIIVPCADNAWCDLLEGTPHGLINIPPEETVPRGSQPPVHDALPVLFWGEGFEDGDRPFAEQRDDGKVVFYADIIASVFFMLSRWEETIIRDRDEHDRFPASSSLACKHGFLDRPIVDEYALIFREWLKITRPDWEPTQRSFAVNLSHDIDNIRRLSSGLIALRTVAADIIKRRSPGRAIRTAMAAMNPRHDPFYQGIHHLVEVSRDFGMKNEVFNFLADGSGIYGGGYELEAPLIKQCIEYLRGEGFSIGLHASYETLNDPERLIQEKSDLDAITGESTYGGRQHFIRFKVPDTWQHWEQAGFVSDSTMIYADHQGFRCGTCHSYRPYDLKNDREFTVWEEPLIAMDTSLAHYRGYSPSEGESQILNLAEKCRRVEGNFTLLWHNFSYDEGWDPTGETYRRVVKRLAEL